MCYSAMIKEEYLGYLRATGAQMDLDQFLDIFWNVAQGGRITVPRAVERWFDEPRSEVEEKIHQLIAQRRAAQAMLGFEDPQEPEHIDLEPLARIHDRGRRLLLDDQGTVGGEVHWQPVAPKHCCLALAVFTEVN